MWILYCLCLVALTAGQDVERLPPSVTINPDREIIFSESSRVTLACRATGTPTITFEWRQNGTLRITTGPASTSLGVSVGDLTITNASRMNDGFYQCNATNQYGSALSTVAHIQHAFLHHGPPTSILNMTVQGGHPFVIPAARRNSFTKPTYNWTTTTVSVETNQYGTAPMAYQLSKRVRDTWNGDLHFAFALKEDELNGSIYKSTVFSAANKSMILVESYTRVTVTQNSGSTPDFPPNITYFATLQVVALTGHNIELKCFFSGKPLPNITWSRPGSNLPIGRHEIPESHHKTLLKIYNTTESDEGDYVCTANNSVGTANQTFNVHDEAVPIFKRVSDGPYNINVTEGDSITFNCSAFAKPNATVVWLRNGQPINVTNPPRRFAFSEDLRSLTIRDVCRNCTDRESKTDLMVIQCNASNDHGYAFSQGYLNVLKNYSQKYDTEEHTIVGNRTSAGEEVSQTSTGDNTVEPISRQESDGPYNLSVTEGDSVTFNCSAFAEPNATVVSLQDAKPIDEMYCDDEYQYRMIWNRISAGREVSQPCPGNTTGSCSRKCLPNGTWSKTNYNGCFDKEFRELLATVRKAREEALKNHTVEDTAQRNQILVAEIANILSALTNKSDGLSPGNLNASIMIINQLADLLRDSNIRLKKTEIESCVKAISNVLQASNAASWKELEKVDKTIVTATLSISDDFGLVLVTLNMPGHVAVRTDNLVLEAWSLETSNLSLQIEFPKGSEWGENRGDGISISLETLKGISSENQSTLNMWGVYYRTIDKMLPGKKDGDDVINSRILSFSIHGLKTNQTLKPPVTITLGHNQEKRRNYRRTCAFWNFNIGDWNSAGCSVTSTNKTHTICSCDHLTNFAILMSRNPVKDDLLALISIICCSISVASLILTAAVYVVTWKHAKSSQAALLLNLCVALVIAYTIFVTGADKFDSKLYSMAGCKVVAVLLHYFFLVAFFIMLAEGIDMVLYIFFVFHVRRTRETIMLIASAWVLPLIIVGVSLGISQLEGYGHKEACWLSIENGLIWAFIGPVMCIIAINLAILIIILRLISQKKALLAGNGEKRNEIRATIWNLSVMCPVLGLGWLFGVFSVTFEHVAFQYVFVIANSLHGLLIFIIYALFHNKKMNETISAVYSNCIGRCGKTGLSVFTKLSSSQDHSTSSTSNTQLTSAQDQSTSGVAPAYGVIAATHMTSAREPGDCCSGALLLPIQHPQKG